MDPRRRRCRDRRHQRFCPAAARRCRVCRAAYAPVAGEVLEINGELDDDTALVNTAPTGAGWFFKMRIADAAQLSELMDEAAYKAFVDEQD